MMKIVTITTTIRDHEYAWLQIEISSSVNSELLAGLRGAGTVFGVVTEITFQLFGGTGDVYAGNLILPDDANLTTLQ